MCEFQREGLIAAGAIASVLDAIRRDIRQELEAEADTKYREVLASRVDVLRDSVKRIEKYICSNNCSRFQSQLSFILTCKSRRPHRRILPSERKTSNLPARELWKNIALKNDYAYVVVEYLKNNRILRTR